MAQPIETAGRRTIHADLRRIGWRCLAVLCACGVATAAGAQRSLHFSGGRWFDGSGFVAAEYYSVAGVLTARRPARVDSVIDLTGKFVVPPYGEAHNHNVESSRIDSAIAMYLRRGVFYVKNPNSLDRFTTPLVGRINVPGSIDATFAGGGLTGSGGHPQAIAQRQIARKAWTEVEGDGGFYYIIDSPADLERRWAEIKAGKRDFIKTYLLYSEEYALRRSDPAYADWRGLDPTLLPEIVRRAHGEGWRVSTHIETAADFHAAVAAGVDEINHLPGFRPDRNDPRRYDDIARYEITESDAQLASANGTFVVTTVGDLLQMLPAADTGTAAAAAARVRGMLTRNLQLLQRTGVRISIGTDAYTKTSDFEMRQLHSLGALSPLALLKAACENSAATIFPGRKIGQLREGYEASFLALDGDPIADFANTQRISLRVKQGTLLAITK